MSKVFITREIVARARLLPIESGQAQIKMLARLRSNLKKYTNIKQLPSLDKRNTHTVDGEPATVKRLGSLY